MAFTDKELVVLSMIAYSNLELDIETSNTFVV